MSDFNRLIHALNKYSVKHEIISTNEIERSYNSYADKTTLLINDSNELLAFRLKIQSDEIVNKIFNEVLQNNTVNHQMFPHLKHISLSSCSLNQLPDSLQKLFHIESLNASFNQIHNLPDWLQNFTNLESLYLIGSKITIDCFPKLINLTYLDISDNGLTFLPDGIQYLTRLTKLNIAENNLQLLPDELQNLTNLNYLNIKSNKLHYLPDWLQKLTKLTRLIVDNNDIQHLPESLQCLKDIELLFFEANKIQFLPEWLCHLTKLSSLRIAKNPFKTIPATFLDMALRLRISTDDLCINDVPDEIIKQGWKAIQQYYTEQNVEILQDGIDDVPFTSTELKVMIIGAGSSGKSSISKAMNYDGHDPNEASTVGIALKNIPCKFREQDWMLRVWDFGGQEAYAATQTLFMTKNTLYLVVADGRTENRPDPYLSYIDTFAPESPVILIINKIDENERAELNRQVYLKNHINLHPKMVRFSCVIDTDKCVKELISEIESVLFSNEYGAQLQAQWTPRWRTVRSDLIELLEKTKTYIDADEYYAICKSKMLPESSWEIVRNACHILGIIFSYRNVNANPPIDRIIHPEWVTKGINSLCKLSESGLYLVKDIYPHMRKQGYSDNETLSILAILQAEELANLLPNQLFFIPALLPSKPPSNFPANYTDWCMDDDEKSKSCEIRFRYPFLHPIVKQTFMVRLLLNNISLYAFRYGAWWYNNGVRVVMMEEYDDLAFYLQGDSNALYIEQCFIQRIMDRLHRDKNIKCTLIHVFRTIDEENGTKYFAEYSDDDLWKLKDVMKVDKLPLPKINKVLSVNEILAGFVKNMDEERSNDMGNTTNVYGNQINVKNSSGAVTTGGDVKDSSITVNAVPTPEQTLFSVETGKAIIMITDLRRLKQNHRDALIVFLNEANDAVKSNNEDKKNFCKEKFNAYITGAGKAIDKALNVLSNYATIASFFNLGS